MIGKIEKLGGTFRKGFKIIFNHPDGYRVDYVFIPEGYMPEFMDDIFSSWMKLDNKKVVITPEEEAEQDRDEFEREQQEMVETYDNPFPTDEALDFDVNVRERV